MTFILKQNICPKIFSCLPEPFDELLHSQRITFNPFLFQIQIYPALIYIHITLYLNQCL